MKNNYVNHLEKGYHQTNFHGIFGGSVAQTVEQRTENPCVGGSIPPRATNEKAPKGLSHLLNHLITHIHSASTKSFSITLKSSFLLHFSKTIT